MAAPTIGPVHETPRSAIILLWHLRPPGVLKTQPDMLGWAPMT
ncbi:hypothetical protein MA3A0122S_3685 [Mycobacteroides abscessus 3A-0122-S]|nr:hypothetical protein MM2B0626_0589 [Mycobacteroides abscessus subsp. bolletii 2B-0626]EIV33661.1 hypothetical protein MA3A0122S_3685 [Mycobacteroides abscessus 3A-0122-S]ETZ80330.1 hypothetical protein L834_0528 [Mycobacteroides abscessus MAB_091912_2455]